MKQRIRLSESSLHRIIKESVRRILREGAFDVWGDAPDYYPADEVGEGDTYRYVQTILGGKSGTWSHLKKVYLDDSEICLGIGGILYTKDGRPLFGTDITDNDYCTVENPFGKCRNKDGSWKKYVDKD